MKDFFDEAEDEGTEEDRLVGWLRETARRLDARIDGELDVRAAREQVKIRARAAHPVPAPVGAGAGPEPLPARPPVRSPDVLLKAAALGDTTAWNDLVDDYQRLVWSVARGYGLSPADAADVSQTTWLRLIENLDRIRDPDQLAAWLATTARREALRTVRLGQREVPDAEVSEYAAFAHNADDCSADPDARLIAEESRGDLYRAFATLPERCRNLLRVMAATPPESYAAVAEALGMPKGSIGPTRSRCLEQLRGAMRALDGGHAAVERGCLHGKRR